ncbi:hypothetical protein BH09MYX1_BH09MYX1_16470 [soil metagenome]
MMPQGYPPAYPAAPPPKKGMSRCLLAPIISGGILAVGAIAVGVAAYAFATSDIGQTTIKVIGATKRLADKGMNAPGTPQIRALVCDQAMVLDMHDFDELMDAFDAGTGDAGHADGLMIMCQVSATHPAPSCDTIASTYVSAVGVAASEFVVTVQQQNGGNRPICRSTYTPAGGLLGTGTMKSTTPSHPPK